MKKLFFILLLASCVTAPVKQDHPPHDCVIISPHSGLPIVIKQGFFNKEEMHKFMTPEEFKKEMEKYYQEKYGL